LQPLFKLGRNEEEIAAYDDLVARFGSAAELPLLKEVALALRKAEPGLGDGPMSWLPAGDGVLAFDRGGVRCVVNISAAAVRLPEHAGLLLASGPLDGELLPPDSAVWLRAGG